MSRRTSWTLGLLLSWRSQLYYAAWNLLMAGLLLGQASLTFADPDCTGVNRWPTRSALVSLKNAGLINDGVDFARTKTVRLASEKLSQGMYRQIHLITFVEKSGNKIEVSTSNVVSNDECSESGVGVFVISKRFGE